MVALLPCCQVTRLMGRPVGQMAWSCRLDLVHKGAWGLTPFHRAGWGQQDPQGRSWWMGLGGDSTVTNPNMQGPMARSQHMVLGGARPQDSIPVHGSQPKPCRAQFRHAGLREGSTGPDPSMRTSPAPRIWPVEPKS